ncbi:CHASE2 domain-containing protein [Oculatella sp. FACHB-28]|uniref:CHASE2 domain-containing protein n=1 Tax=Oculatella sp. FACHB-28 TaxID=2692845 RepID=UPI0016847E84|nr:CHASE2 domain-containing protein [Oculatella sp. FACHB-28]MBD2059436.1 CHASE2 domain-containing protein [Oculatella sp. FACHB-28]
MVKLIVLSLGEGNLSKGFASVTAQLWDESDIYPMKFIGRLAAAPQLAELYRRWRLLYLALYQRLDFELRLEIETADVTNVSEIELSDLCQQLFDQLNHWLNSEPFHSIDQSLRTQLAPSDQVRFIIETNDPLLRHLPWHLWQLFEDYPKAEMALSTSSYQRPNRLPINRNSSQVKILAILGNSQAIDVEKDRVALEQLASDAEIEFLVEPTLEELNEYLWQGWDILFYAGHSSSDDFGSEKGLLQLNQTDRLTLEQLRYALKRAIAQGLKLAIFNSCDGLGLAQSLADLHIPQVIVMREPVPDEVAQTFLRHFLAAFAGGQPLYVSVREARERLQGLEDNYPCATWLPMICQNPAESPPSWQSLRGQVDEAGSSHLQPQPQPPQILPTTATPSQPKKQRRQRIFSRIRMVCLVSVLATSLVVGVRSIGVLQPFELRAFDQLMQLRPAESPDNRLLVITIDDADVQYQEQRGMQRKGSLSDQAFAQLLQKLEPHQPRIIASDIYHEFEFEPSLAAYLEQRENIISVCRMGQADDEQILPPPDMPAERLGFTNSVLDPDNVIRRHLLGMASDSYCPTNQSLSLQAATAYLEQLKVLPLQFTEAGVLQVGGFSFPKLEFNTGGYQLSTAEANGYQTLLNYRSAAFTQIPLRQILDGSLGDSQLAELVKDRIILIGVTISNVDSHLTPYRGKFVQAEMPGVVIQAHMISQIISAVLDQRSLLWWLPQWLEFVWIGCWAGFGGVLVWRWRSPFQKYSLSRTTNMATFKLGLSVCLSLVILHGVCFMFLLWGGWLPLVPAALALIISSGGVATQIRRLR